MNEWLNSFGNKATKKAVIQTISEYEGVPQDKVKEFLVKCGKSSKADINIDLKLTLVEFAKKHELTLSELMGFCQFILSDLMIESKLDTIKKVDDLKKRLSKEE